MKKNTIFLLLTAMTLFLSSCNSKEIEVNQGGSQTNAHLVHFQVLGQKADKNLRATTTQSSPLTVTALDRESKVSQITAVLYEGNKFYRKFTAVLDSQTSTYKFDALKAGTFSMYLIANGDPTLIDKINATNTATPEELSAQLATQSPGEGQNATNFLMTSEVKEVTTTTGADADAGKISLERVAARFDVYNRVAKLQMSKLTLKKRYTKSLLHRGSANMNMSSDLKQSAVEKEYTSQNGLEPYQFIGGIYSYENLEVGQTALTVEATYDGVAIAPFDIVIEGKPIKRNHLYSIIISPKNGSVNPSDVAGSLNFDIKVNDWSEDATIILSNDDLIGNGIPSFSISGVGVRLDSNENPSKGIITTHNATTLTLTVKSDNIGSRLEPIGNLPSGVVIKEGEVKVNQDESGVIEQTFTVSLPAAADADSFVPDFGLRVVNALHPNKGRDITFTARPKMALEYVAEYNVNADGTGFVTTHANEQNRFNFAEAQKLFGTPSSISPALRGYHIPTKEEGRSIFPSKKYSGQVILYYGTKQLVENYSDEIKFGDVTGRFSSDFNNMGKVNGVPTTYALRMKNSGNQHLTAFRYTYENAPEGGKQLVVKAIYLGPYYKGTVQDFSNEAFWTEHENETITRIFPAVGQTNHPAYNNNIAVGRGAGYWTVSRDSEHRGEVLYEDMYFNERFADVFYGVARNVKSGIRLFKDN